MDNAKMERLEDILITLRRCADTATERAMQQSESDFMHDILTDLSNQTGLSDYLHWRDHQPDVTVCPECGSVEVDEYLTIPSYRKAQRFTVEKGYTISYDDIKGTDGETIGYQCVVCYHEW